MMQEHVYTLKVLERISRISISSHNVKEMLERVLNEMLDIFHCDRAWFLFPCDPNAAAWGVPMECTRPQWPGALSLGVEYPMTAEVEALFSNALSSDIPLAFDKNSGLVLPAETVKAFSIRAQMVVAVYPIIGQAWLMGIHHCEEDHLFTADEKYLFDEIRLRIADSLSNLITLDNLHASEEMYHGLFLGMGQGVVYLDASGHILSANPAAERILGLYIDTLRGKNVADIPFSIVHEDGTPFTAETQPHHIALATGKAVPDVVMGICSGNENQYRWIQATTIPQFLPGKETPFQVFITFTDITELKLAKDQAEAALLEKIRLEAATAAKSAFLANMSHEIRTPLTAIIGFAESTLQSGSTMQQRIQAIETVIRNGKHLLHIINEILDLSKIEANKLDIDLHPIALFDVIGEIEPLISMQARNKGLQFSVDYHYPMPAFLSTDGFRLKQILLNLCANAVKFTPSGSVGIEVSYHAAQQNIVIVVADSGIGLSEEKIATIFEDYTQATPTTERTYGGTGLGLPIARKLAALLGGDITVSSQIDKGSRFMLRLPVGTSAPLIYSPPTRGHQAIRASHQHHAPLTGRVLLAEDNPDLQRLISFFVEQFGLQVTVVDNGEKALDKAMREHHDVILMDMQMPVMNGIQAVKALRQGGCKTPVIMLTANAMQSDEKIAMLAGCDDFLPKPIDHDILYATLHKYLAAAEVTHIDAEPLPSQLRSKSKKFDLLIEEFVQSLPVSLAGIDDALQRHDWEALEMLFHQLKGLGGSYGYPTLTDLAAKARFHIINRDLGEVRKIATELCHLCARIRSGVVEASNKFDFSI